MTNKDFFYRRFDLQHLELITFTHRSRSTTLTGVHSHPLEPTMQDSYTYQDNTTIVHKTSPRVMRYVKLKSNSNHNLMQIYQLCKREHCVIIRIRSSTVIEPPILRKMMCERLW